LDHPDQAIINLKNVSHHIVEMHWDGNNLVGTVEVLSTPSGNILKELFKSGIKLGISSRGEGSVEPIGEGDKVIVKDDYNVICWDFVSNPSTNKAFLTPVNESIKSDTGAKKSGLASPYAKIEEIIRDIISELA